MISQSLKSLGDLLCVQPTARKLVVVPNGVGTSLARALARGGVDWSNSLFVTPRDLAVEIAEADLVASGYLPLHRDRLQLWLRDNLPRLIASPGSFFAGVRFGHPLVASVARNIDALRQAGIGPMELSRTSLRADKKGPLVDLLDAFESYLLTGGLYDDAALFIRAAELAPEYPKCASLIVFGDVTLSMMSAKLLNSIRADVRVVFSDSGDTPPAGTALAVLEGWSRVDCPIAAPRAIAAQTALAPEHEVDAVLSDILATGKSFDDVELAYGSSRYRPVIASALRGTFPASFLEGTPIFQTRPGQALLAYLRWLASNQDSAELAMLMQSRSVSFRGIGGIDRVYPNTLGAFLVRRLVGPGKEGIEDALGRWEKEIAYDQFASDSQLETIGGLRTVADALYRSVPAGSVTSARELAARSSDFLQTFVIVRGEDDARQVSLLIEQLDRLGEADSNGTLVELAQFFYELIRGRSIDRSASVPGAIHVVPIDRSGFSGRRHLYIVGLDEQSFPPGAIDDPVLLDEERRKISESLQTSTARSRQITAAFGRAVRRAPETLSVVSSRMDPIFGREMDWSTTLDSFLRERKVDVVDRALGSTTEVLSDSGAVLAERDSLDYDRHAATHFPWMAAGAKAQVLRSQTVLSEYSGYLGIPTPELDVRGPNWVLSASALERLARCPYQHFVQRILRVRPPDEVERRPGRWLSNLQFGNLLHELLCDFMTEVAARGQRPDLTAGTVLMQAMLDDKLAKWQSFVAPAGEAAFARERALLEQALTVFLGSESRRDSQPVAFEAQFGFDADTTAPLRLADDILLRLRGSIDRVDRAGEGYEIWDYKSGSSQPFSAGLLDQVLHLQWALYAYVWADLLQPADGLPVSRSGYFFTSGRGLGERISAPPPSRSDVADRLRPLVRMTALGAFPHLQAKSEVACNICDYRNICASERREPKDLPEQALFNDEDEALAAVRNWAERIS